MSKINEVVLFDETAKLKILSYFNKGVDKNNFIIDKKTGEKVLTPDGEEIELNNFGSIFIGSELYIKDDIVSIVKFLQKTQDGSA